MNDSFWLFGSHHYIIAAADKTEMHYDLIEKRSKPGVETPLHVHNGYTELVYVLDGQLTVFTELQTVILNPGDCFFIPRGAVHTLAATGLTGTTRTLQCFAPGGFSKLLRAVGTAGTEYEMPAMKPLDMDLLNQLCDELGDVNLSQH